MHISQISLGARPVSPTLAVAEMDLAHALLCTHDRRRVDPYGRLGVGFIAGNRPVARPTRRRYAVQGGLVNVIHLHGRYLALAGIARCVESHGTVFGPGGREPCTARTDTAVNPSESRYESV